jgi:hypothetical protein
LSHKVLTLVAHFFHLFSSFLVKESLAPHCGHFLGLHLVSLVAPQLPHTKTAIFSPPFHLRISVRRPRHTGYFVNAASLLDY